MDIYDLLFETAARERVPGIDNIGIDNAERAERKEAREDLRQYREEFAALTEEWN